MQDILQIKPAFLKYNSDNKEIVYKKILYLVVISELIKYLDDKSDYFLSGLTILMKGLKSQIDIRKNSADAERLKNTQELIEEKVIPILVNLTDEETQHAEEILKLSY